MFIEIIILRRFDIAIYPYSSLIVTLYWDQAFYIKAAIVRSHFF